MPVLMLLTSPLSSTTASEKSGFVVLIFVSKAPKLPFISARPRWLTVKPSLEWAPSTDQVILFTTVKETRSRNAAATGKKIFFSLGVCFYVLFNYC